MVVWPAVFRACSPSFADHAAGPRPRRRWRCSGLGRAFDRARSGRCRSTRPWPRRLQPRRSFPIGLPVRTFDRRADAAQATTPPAYQPYPLSFAVGAARTAEADEPVAVMGAPVALVMAERAGDGGEPDDRYCVESGGGVELSGCGGYFVGGESGGRGGGNAAVSAEAPPGGRGGGAPPAPALFDALASCYDKCAAATAWCAAPPVRGRRA